MNNNFREGLKALKEISDPEKMKMTLERITGKKLADYEGIDALVGALMGYYNEELKNKINSSQLDEKFKNFCPYGIGDIFITTSSINPSSVYLGTTWQKLEDVILKSTSSINPSTKQIIGSDTISIKKENLPNIKLKTESHNHTEGSHYHYLFSDEKTSVQLGSKAKFVAKASFYNVWDNAVLSEGTKSQTVGETSPSMNSNMGNASPNTENLGNGVALNITPKSYIVNMWLRIS